MRILIIAVCSIVCWGQMANGQIIPRPVDDFERVRWHMPLSELRKLPSKIPLQISRSRKTGEVSQNRGHVFFARQECALGESLQVSYAIHTSDSTLRYVLFNAIFVEGASGSSRWTLDSIWQRLERRYGPTSVIEESGTKRRVWNTPTSVIEAFRIDGRVRGITLTARPVNSSK